MLIVRLAIASSLAVAALAQCSPPPPSAKPIPLEHFFVQPVIGNARLSPDGKRVAFLGPVQKRMSVMLYEVATAKLDVVVHDPKEDIDLVFWKGDDLLLFGGDIGGNESYMLGALNLKTRKIQRLAESRKDDFQVTTEAGIVDPLTRDPDHVLILGTKANAGRRRNAAFDNPDLGIYLLNVRTGTRKFVEAWDGTTYGWTPDPSGTLRLRIRARDELNLLEYRESASAPWSVLYTHSDREPPPWVPVRLAADGRTVYALTEGDHGTSLRTFDLASRTLSQPIFTSENGEIGSPVFKRGTDQLIGVTYITDRARVKWFDASRAKLAEIINNTLPETENALVSSSLDDQVHLIRAWSDRDPDTYYVLDVRAGKMAMLASSSPEIDPARMRPMEAVSFTARDGMKIPAYLTRPAAAAGGRVPLILLPHGGPYGVRDEWRFDPEVQFLASRGYAVLQVNYRGSGGCGRKHLEAGRGEWGAKMQDDLTDAVRWATEEKIADPKRVAIFGASYGGYAALAGVTFTPELFKCAVNYVGVSDLRLLTRWSSGETRLTRRFYETWVSPDSAQLTARSPVNFVARIRVPTLHAYGANDPRVKIEHWRRLEAELKKHAKPYEFIEARDEGHGFRGEENRINFHRKLEDFLARNL